MKLFEPDETYLPITMQQFEALTNEILAEVNTLSDPHFLEGDYLAQILTSTIHSIKKDQALVSKTDLFYGCVNRISNHVTFHACEAINKRRGAKPEAMDQAPGEAGEPVPVQVAQSGEVQH